MIRRGFGSRSVEREATLRVRKAAREIPEEVETVRSLGKAPPGRKVLVVGAGMAGLCAALELESLGYEVTVLEADEFHAGGRVRTLRFDGGRYGEAGAMRIPQDHELTRFYIDQLGLTMRPFVFANEKAWLSIRGGKYRMGEAEKARQLFDLLEDEKLLTDLQLWQRAVGTLAAALSDAEQEDLYRHSPEFLGSMRLDELSLHGQFLQSGLSSEAIQLLASSWNLETTLQFGLAEHLREELEGVWAEPFDEVAGGLDQLPHGIAAKLGNPVVFGAPVVAMEQSDGGVTVYAQQNGQRKTYQADWLICTVPLGVLPRIDYAQGWSPRKADAIRRVNYDDSTKVLALTKSRFWEVEDGIFGGGSVSDGVLGSTWYPSDNAVEMSEEKSREPSVLLASYSWGQTARRMVGMDRETVVDDLAILHECLRSDPDQIEDLVTWSWKDHPWSAGAYAFYHPGDQTELHGPLMEREGRIVLAGEHASLHHSWIQGAISSGLRAVEQIASIEAAN
ncbi:flavin monoamine oxidase family protein [Tsuneonella flava]|uniref:flavin monoamine oxidase family protein n=1 Tax=Tsuneonella flava TaxID=2055955 RepID=UPI000C804E60|nr:FAD-dependent oxidoreductase [Tsuneonella flava]